MDKKTVLFKECMLCAQHRRSLFFLKQFMLIVCPESGCDYKSVWMWLTLEIIEYHLPYPFYLAFKVLYFNNHSRDAALIMNTKFGLDRPDIVQFV